MSKSPMFQPAPKFKSKLKGFMPPGIYKALGDAPTYGSNCAAIALMVRRPGKTAKDRFTGAWKDRRAHHTSRDGHKPTK